MRNINLKTFDSVFIGYAQNSATYRFVSSNDFSICESMDVEVFEHVFPLKKNNTMPIQDDENMPASSSIARESIHESRRSKR